MTQILRHYNTNSMPNEKRAFSGASLSGNRQVNGKDNQVSQKIKSFFRINSSGSKDSLGLGKDSNEKSESGTSTPRGLRQSRFLPHIGRNRSQTVASEGDTLDQGMSPTANANPYFQHQGPPALRHHDETSVPPSPSGTGDNPLGSDTDINGAADAGNSKDDLARRLRKVASAPNAQALFTKENQKRPRTPDAKSSQSPSKSMTGSSLAIETSANGDSSTLLPVPSIGISPSKLRDSVAFRRTYSSNSIKVRNVEVGPGSFDKIKLIGKGDVGKVYLVREKKSSRLYAMKGAFTDHARTPNDRY